MPGILDLVTYVLLGIGILFNALGVIGLLRFPDLYTRMHATTKATTFGSTGYRSTANQTTPSHDGSR